MYNSHISRRGHNGSLRSSRWSASIAVAVLLSCSLSAQNYPNGLNEDSVDPKGDKAFFIQANERMNEIRKTYKRPTVGLVLSGGGAKGAAEAGALMFLEELGIPVDLVCGTSAGGLVGGLYAMGYSPEELKELFMTQDWGKILSDDVDSQYIPYIVKQYQAKTFLSTKLGKNQRVSTSTLLPSGIAYGFNVNNLFSSLAVGYEGDISFSDLPIPFACVSADIVSCKAYNMVDGSVTDAMRSTMSIPGLFNPVRKKEMVLVDGGVRNNFPADLAKAMGADIIIGVELSDLRPTYERVNHIGNILGQFISMLNREVYDNNLDLADIIIKPNLDGYNMLSFTPEAVEVMVERGYNAAKEKEEELRKIKELVGDNVGTLRTDRRATNIDKNAVNIKSITFQGLTDMESAEMIRYIKLDITKPVKKADLERVMGLLQATNYFSEVKYGLEGKSDPYDLVFYCNLAPTNRFGLGLRGDTIEGVALYTNFGYNANKISGSKIDLEMRISQNFKALFRYSFVIPGWPVLNAEASFANTHMEYMLGEEKQHITTHYQSHNESLYFSAGRWKKINFKLGIQNQSFKTIGIDALSILLDSRKKETYTGFFGELHLNTFDDSYFPTRGTNIRFEGRYDFTSFGTIPNYNPTSYFSLAVKQVVPIASRFVLIPSVQAVAKYVPSTNYYDPDTNELYMPLYTVTYVGGMLDKRYHRNHIPFFGITKAFYASDFVFTGVLEGRYNPTDNLYISLLGGYLRSGGNQSFWNKNSFNTTTFAVGTEISYKASLGPLNLYLPIKFNFHWNTMYKFGASLSVGYDF